MVAASEPLCIAQGATANVPKFPRRHRLNTTNSPPVSPPPHQPPPTRQPASIVGIHPRINVPRSPPTSKCLRYGPLPLHVSTARDAASRAATPPSSHWTRPLTVMQALNKTRRKKNVKKGIQFCLMVCGASGTGRTTFVNTLCGQQVLTHKESDDPSAAHLEEGVKIKPITVGMSPHRYYPPSQS